MLNCMMADMARVIKKKSVIIWLAVQILLIIGAAITLFFLKRAGIELVFKGAMSICNTCAMIIIGIPVFLAVFKDDLQSKAMQNTIGMGVSRVQLVFARFLETSIIYIICFLILMAVTFAAGIPFGTTMADYMEIIREACEIVLKMVCYTAISMIVVFGTMNTSFAQSIFMLLNLGIVGTVIQALNMIPFLMEHNIDLTYATIDGVLKLAKSSTFAAAPLMWVVLFGGFLVLPLILTIVIFNKKELAL